MNEKFILCQVSLFSINQRIILRDGDNAKDIGSVPMERLEETIVDLCHKYKTNKVHLLGNSKYLKSCADIIKTYGMSKYNNKIIEVEIN